MSSRHGGYRITSFKKQVFEKSPEPSRPPSGSLGYTRQRKAADGDVFHAENFSHSCLGNPQTSVYKQEDEPHLAKQHW